jgi:PAS domain S-box-containing protein
MVTNIRQQTLLLAILPMFLAVILLDGYFLYSRFISMEAGMAERAKTLARQVGSAGEFAFFSGNYDQLQTNASVALKQINVDFVAIKNVSGQLVITAGESISGDEIELLNKVDYPNSLIDTNNYFWVREPIYSELIEMNEFEMAKDRSASKLLGYVFIKMNKTRIQKEKVDVIVASSLVSILILTCTIFFVIEVSRRIVNPINALNQMVQSIGEGNLNIRISPLPAVKELRELALGINDTAKRLQEDKTSLDDHIDLLHSSEERLSNIIEMMPVALFIKDARSRITFMNKVCELQWGVLFSNIVGTDASEYFPPEQVAGFLKNDREVFDGRKMVSFEELVWNSETNENRTLHTFKKPIYTKDGHPLYLLCISIDISERISADFRLKQLNEQLEMRIEAATRELRMKRDDAVNASYDKTRFLATASHDLRQPMHALGLFVGELQAKLTTHEQHKVVGKIEESVDALSKLLDALLDISKLDAGVVVVNIKTFSIEVLLTRLAAEYAPLAQSKGIDLRLVPSSVYVSSDPVLLERILINLITNAIRYTPVGGRVLVGCRIRGDRLRIEVRDNGIGIQAKDQSKIFREFIQLANPERDRGKGLGLGLAIVERTAKLLKHHISLRSEPDKGSAFAVYVPRVPEAASEMVLVPLSANDESTVYLRSGSLENLRVLVIDDDALVRKGTQGILESWGCSVSSVASFYEFKEIKNKEEFGLVICDYRLPDGDGVEIMGWIEANIKIQPKFILITGDISPEILLGVREKEINVLHKPVRPAKLRSLIQYLLNPKTDG